MLRREDIPRRFNVATYFVDRNVEEGRGDRAALLTDAGAPTYAELAELVNRVGGALRELGVRQGDRVLLALSDGVEFVATWYAAQKIGAVTAEVYTYLPVKDYAYFLSYTEASVVVVDAVTLDAIREAVDMSRQGRRTLLVVGGEDDRQRGEHDFAAMTAQASPELDAAPTTRDDVAIWKFTTGSTGAPKAC